MHAFPEPRASVDAEAPWRALLAWRTSFRAGRRIAPPDLAGWELAGLYLPLCRDALVGDGLVVAHLAQSLDGRIATAAGVSRWISGPEDLLHTHRLRALADAVVVGAGTVALDDPLLTVRRCEGPCPVRVVLDAGGKLPREHRIFADGAPTILVAAPDAPAPAAGAEVLRLEPREGRFAASAVKRALAARGLSWLFVEGGGVTVSRFLAEGALDRLHLAIAPVLLGSGRPGISLPEVTDPARGLRPMVRRFDLGGDILVDCAFR